MGVELVELQLLLTPRNPNHVALLKPRSLGLPPLLVELIVVRDLHRLFVVFCVGMRLLNHNNVQVSHIILNVEIVVQTQILKRSHLRN